MEKMGEFYNPFIVTGMTFIFVRDVNVLIFLDFSFRYDSVHQKYKRLKRYVAHYKILWHRVTLRNEFSALEYHIQR